MKRKSTHNDIYSEFFLNQRYKQPKGTKYYNIYQDYEITKSECLIYNFYDMENDPLIYNMETIFKGERSDSLFDCL